MVKAKIQEGLGYCNLHQINLSLVAKLGWKLLTQPDSLAAEDKVQLLVW